MTSINSEVRSERQFLNLKLVEKDKVKKEALKLLVKDEVVEGAFQTVRDQVIFTNKRVMTVNYQGVTGTRVSMFNYPYSKIQYYAIETGIEYPSVSEVERVLELAHSSLVKAARNGNSCGKCHWKYLT